mmetsp:Transcript_10816/g.26452  ORF Transcript_10816/g.26452 Transcript_10816/m.26452 type:complete len:150 (-) Transcript_10816:305-754(-)
MAGTKPTVSFFFVRAVKTYKEIERKNRRKKADVIIKKYLNPGNKANYIHPKEELIQKVKKTLDDLDTAADDESSALKGTRYGQADFNASPKDLFDNLEAETKKRLQGCFEEGYLKSGVHRLYCATIKLPPYYYNRAMDVLKLKAEKDGE